MSIADRDLEKAITSTEAMEIRGKMSVKRGNKFIQEVHNSLHHPSNERHCGYDLND